MPLYSQIIKKSYSITTRYKILWFFGLFVIGGTNVNFLKFQNFSIPTLRQFNSFGTVLYFKDHPGALALVSILVLCMAGISLIFTNWARVMLILCAESIIDHENTEIRKHLLKIKRKIITVSGISLSTSFLIVIVAAGLLLTPIYFGFNISAQTMLWVVGVSIFLPIAFIISCINIFTTFFIVIFDYPFTKALNLGADFFGTNWLTIFGLSLLLFVIYGACFAIGISLISIVSLISNQFFSHLLKFNFFSLSAIILVPRLIAGVLLWILIAGLNVFINTALLLLFLKLVTPIKTPEAEVNQGSLKPVV